MAFIVQYFKLKRVSKSQIAVRSLFILFSNDAKMHMSCLNLTNYHLESEMK